MSLAPPASLEPTTSAPGTAPSSRPGLGAVVRRVMLSITVACAIPAALFYTVFAFAGVWVAIGVALAWSYGALAWRAATGRRTSGLLVLTAAVMTGRTLISVAAGSTFLYFLQPIVTDTVVGLAFLVSLLGARPLVARLAGDFYPMTAEIAARPRVQRLFRGLTAMWALLYLGKATFTLWLLLSASLADFVLIKMVTVTLVNFSAAGPTILIASTVGRREGLLSVVPAPAPALAA
jgi:hypothetical protein